MLYFHIYFASFPEKNLINIKNIQTYPTLPIWNHFSPKIWLEGGRGLGWEAKKTFSITQKNNSINYNFTFEIKVIWKLWIPLLFFCLLTTIYKTIWLHTKTNCGNSKKTRSICWSNVLLLVQFFFVFLWTNFFTYNMKLHFFGILSAHNDWKLQFILMYGRMKLG